MVSLFHERLRPAFRENCLGLRTTSPSTLLEQLEPRLALDIDSVSRPTLEPSSTLAMDASMGPHPIIMSKSEIVGNDVSSFVISHVPLHSVVEKWDLPTGTWIDVSTKPTSSNPEELLHLLSTRVIHHGDLLRWRPKAGTEDMTQPAFEIINWHDGSAQPQHDSQAPSAIQNLQATPTGVDEISVSWDASDGASSYTVTMEVTNDEHTSLQRTVAAVNSVTFTDLSAADTITFSVTASNMTGTSEAVQTTVTFLAAHDFAYGTYIIDQPGTYILREDISFNPNSPLALSEAVKNKAIPTVIAEQLGWTDGVDAYSAGNPLPTQFGDYSGPFTPGGLMEPRYNPAAYGIGFFAAIAITSDDVTLDLNGFALEQSAEHALLQRFFAVIELANQPFIPNQGPHAFGAELQAATGVTIRNGTIGRSSHHGIHGNLNRDVTIRDVAFVDYEVGAVALNGVDGLLVENVTATNRKDVPVLGTFSSARFASRYIDALVRSGSTTTLNANGTRLTAVDVQQRLREAINAVHEDIIIDAIGAATPVQINAAEHPVEHALFHNPFGVVDGNSYSFLLNQVGVAVHGFPVLNNLEPDNLSSEVIFKDVQVIDQYSFINEVVALDVGGKPAIDPVGAVFQLRNLHPDTNEPLTVTSLTESESRYIGNPVANAQAFIAKAAANGDFANLHLDTSRLNISEAVLNWLEGKPGSETLEEINASWLCNGDSMFHVNKGAIAFKMDAARDVQLIDTSVNGLFNFGASGSMACGDYTNGFSNPQATLKGYGGNAVRAYTAAGSTDIRIEGARIENIESWSGLAVGIAILTDSSNTSISNVFASDIKAGLIGPTDGPDPDPIAAAVYVGATTENVHLESILVDGLASSSATHDVFWEGIPGAVSLGGFVAAG